MDKTAEELELEKQQLEKQQADDRKALEVQMRRDISKEYGLNAFDAKEVKAKLDKMTEWEQSQKTEQEKLQEQLTSYESKQQEWATEKAKYDFKFGALENNIDSTKIDKLYKLTDGDATKIEEVLKEFPSFVKQETNKNQAHITLQTKQQKPNEGDIPPVLAAFRKKRSQ
jgi:hypothetical protein